MLKLNHVHKFKRSAYKTGNKFYFCTNDCDYKVAIELALGKTSECWRCGRPFKMNSYAITLDKPHCEECHNFKGDKRKPKKRPTDTQTQPLTAVADLAGSDLTTNLRGRLDEIMSSSISFTDNPVIIDNPTITTETVQIKEFKLEDEEEFI